MKYLLTINNKEAVTISVKKLNSVGGRSQAILLPILLYYYVYNRYYSYIGQKCRASRQIL